MTDRDLLLSLFDTAVAAADPMRVIPAALPDRPTGRCLIIGAGKASARMAEAVEAAWGPCEGYVITRYGYARPCQGIKIVEAAHPVPDAAGQAATETLLSLVSDLGADDTVIALISGGGSALLCAPGGDMTLADDQAVNAALLASGAPIGQMNVVRKHLSRIKGGQLAAAIAPAKLITLMISDVPGDDPADIASGPTVGEASTVAEAREILDDWTITLPDAALTALSQSGVLAVGDPRLERVENHIVAAPSQSLAAAATRAQTHGIEVMHLGDALEGEARDLARAHAARALALQAKMNPTSDPVLLLSGGECTVTRRGDGIGGPNAEYALALAIALDGAPGISALACDTDGVDGAAEVAGATIDPAVPTDAARLGLSLEEALANNDAHTAFARLGRQVIPGPTLTNVNDFRAILIRPA